MGARLATTATEQEFADRCLPVRLYRKQLTRYDT